MSCSLKFLVCISVLVVNLYGQPSNKLEGTFSGENINCGGLSAKVNVNDQIVQVEEQAIVEAVSTAFVNAIKSPEGAISEAKSIGTKVLEVTAKAVATVEASINSPHPGCWAIAYGSAKAQAIATAIVDSIARGIAVALGTQGVQADSLATATDTQQTVSEAAAKVALLLVSGDGSGPKTGSGVATAEAKAVAIGCALAQTMAEVYKDDGPTAEAIATAGCGPDFEIGLTVFEVDESVPCQCQSRSSMSGVVSGCGAWGGADEFCYVQDPVGCSCAQQSDKFAAQKWRFCGSTLNTMKSWLDFEDKAQGIQRSTGKNGYCPTSRS